MGNKYVAQHETINLPGFRKHRPPKRKMPTVVMTETDTGLPNAEEIGVSLPKAELDRLIAEEATRLRALEKARRKQERVERGERAEDIEDEVEEELMEKKKGVPVWGWIVIAMATLLVVGLLLGAIAKARRNKQQLALIRSTAY